MSLFGNSIRTENINNSRKLLDETFEDDASFISGMYLWELGLNNASDFYGKDTIKIRLFSRMFSNANGVMVQFQTPINYKLVVGDVIFDSNRNDFLLVTEVFNFNDIHWQGKLTLCNWILKWQDKNTGKILEYPCHDINSTQYNSGERSNRNFTVGSSQHMITLPLDENTVLLNHPNRFYLDNNAKNPSSFMVTQNDTTSYAYGEKGLVRLTLYEDVRNFDADRVDLGVCDYVDPDSLNKNKPEYTNLSNSIIVCSSKVIKSGGDKQTFIGKFFDDNNNEITSLAPKWNIICDFKDKLEIAYDNNAINIGIDNDNYIDEEFKLVLSDENGNYSSVMLIKIGALF